MLQIRLLGQFDVRSDSKRLTIPSRTAQSIFAYLALTRGTSHRREKLAGMFWPDLPDESARKNLRQELWRIRKAIPAPHALKTDYLASDEWTLCFSPEAEHWLDVAQLERPELDLQSLISNLSLYQGELMPGFYDDWITLERERVQAVFEARMEQLLEQLINAERWMSVEEWGERWLALGSARETAYRALMLASGVRGDMAKVSSIYQRCVEDMQDQLGLEPSAETRALYDGLLKGARAPLRSATVQPFGTVTFLFTDIEGSTRLLEKLGSQYATVLADHHKILRAAIQEWNGREMDTQGDAFFVTFARASDAIQCAAEAQRRMAAHTWHLDGPVQVRIRMGLHTGEPLIASTGYIGMDVHRAARIGDAAHGGQVLLSQATRELVLHDLPPGLTIRDLGEHRLKDMKYPASIYQLVIDGLQADFPPLRTRFSGAEAPAPGDPPFKGLDYFDEADSDLFYGRELLTARLVDRLRQVQFLSVIIGASGRGKSSLVRAGIVPALKKGETLMDGVQPPEGSPDWQVHVITPTAHPLEALALELTRDSESVTSAATLMDDLKQDPRSLALFLARKNPDQHTLLVLDQFEELFTLCRDEFEREAFIDNLLATISAPEAGEWRRGRVTLILTLRADFYAHLAQYPELRDAVASQQEYIGPMTSEDLRRAMEEPARLGHWEFEPGLVDLILRDVGDEPGALPLLSHALLETWKRRAGHTLTLKGYADAGGVHGAIAHTAEGVYQDLSPDEQRIARDLFLRLTELGEGTEDTRRRASFQELMSSAADAGEVRAVLNALAGARLVTLGEDTAEVAHEALIREWPTLREWLNQDREGLRLHRHLTESAQEWELLDRDPGALYRGAHLAQAREWAVSHPNVLNSREQAFLAASIDQEEREEHEREQQQRRELEAAKKLAETERARAEEQKHASQRLRLRAWILAGLLLVAGFLAIAAFGLSRQRDVTAKLATSRELAAASVSSLEVDPERSILLALEALSTVHTREAEAALHQAVFASRVEMTLRGHAGGVGVAVYSPNGSRIATAGEDGNVRVWDAHSGENTLTLAGHTGPVHGVIFSPDGNRIATAGEDGTARIWEAGSGEMIWKFEGGQQVVIGLAFSPDAKRLATGGVDGSVILWDVGSGAELQRWRAHEDAVISIAFTPDAQQVVTSSFDENLIFWDAASGEKLRTLAGVFDNLVFSEDGGRLAANFDEGGKIMDVATGGDLVKTGGHTNEVYSAAVDPDWTRIATAGMDRKIIISDAGSGRILFSLSGHTGEILDVHFSPDGKHLVTASADGTARVWSAGPASEALTIQAHESFGRIAVSPDGRLLAAGAGQDLKAWDMETGQERFSFEMPSRATGVAFAPTASRLAGATETGAIAIWDLRSGEKELEIKGSDALVFFLAFSPDGDRLASGGEDNLVRIWDSRNGNLLLTLEGDAYPVPAVAFSPDGSRLASGSFSDSAIVWDAASGEKLFTLQGHTDTVWGIVFSPDGKRIATASRDGTARIWDAAGGQELHKLTGHTSTVVSLFFSPDGKQLATTGRDGVTKLWDTVNGKLLLNLYGDGAGLVGVVFSPDGKFLATLGTESIHVYLMQLDDLIAFARTQVTRSLTEDECLQYLHMDHCPLKSQ